MHFKCHPRCLMTTTTVDTLRARALLKVRTHFIKKLSQGIYCSEELLQYCKKNQLDYISKSDLANLRKYYSFLTVLRSPNQRVLLDTLHCPS